MADGAEDRDADGFHDAGERNPTRGNGGDDDAVACSAAPLWEVSGAASVPAHGVRVAKQGADAVVTWNDEIAARGDTCVLYRVYVATNVHRPDEQQKFRLLATTGMNQWVHQRALASDDAYTYVIVAWSASAGEGSWGAGRDTAGNPVPRR